MPKTHAIKHGEMIDLVCYRHYGRTRDVTELVLAANPGLSELGPLPPIGTLVHLPDINSKPQLPALVNLWD
jgi:phage tail protein X